MQPATYTLLGCFLFAGNRFRLLVAAAVGPVRSRRFSPCAYVASVWAKRAVAAGRRFKPKDSEADNIRDITLGESCDRICHKLEVQDIRAPLPDIRSHVAPAAFSRSNPCVRHIYSAFRFMMSPYSNASPHTVAVGVVGDVRLAGAESRASIDVLPSAAVDVERESVDWGDSEAVDSVGEGGRNLWIGSYASFPRFRSSQSFLIQDLVCGASAVQSFLAIRR